ncbi:MAG: 4Fe-4S ferredoxin, partial [Acidobacteriota bacterium]
MKDKIIERAKELLETGKIAGFLGLREWEGHVSPHLFTKAEELSDLSLGDVEKPGDARYPLNQILIDLSRAYPEATFGVLVRGCDERGLIELYKWNQLDRERVIPVGLVCPEELARACSCANPSPADPVAGERTEPVASEGPVDAIDALSLAERFEYWMGHFERCVKC